MDGVRSRIATLRRFRPSRRVAHREIELIVDEGPTRSIPDDPAAWACRWSDNIYVNGRIITSGTGIAPGGGPGRDDD